MLFGARLRPPPAEESLAWALCSACYASGRLPARTYAKPLRVPSDVAGTTAFAPSRCNPWSAVPLGRATWVPPATAVWATLGFYLPCDLYCQ